MSIKETLKKVVGIKATTLPVQEGENIIEYDRDNLAAYREMQEAEKLLANMNTKGFRKPSNKEIAKAREVVQEYRRIKAQTFLEEHKKRIMYYGVEIKAHFEEVKGTGLIKPSLTIADFNPFKGIANTKPWSEALEDNLATRINCTHKLNEDETVCELCGLNPENWGENKEGVTNDYQDKQRAKIDAEKAKELACKNGDHVLDEAAGICTNCRKPKEAWENKEGAETGEVKETAEQG